MQETWVWSLGQEDLLEEDMATHCSILLWRMPWTEEPRELESVGSLRVGHGWATNISATAFKTRKLPDIQTKDCRSASVCILLELHPLRYSQTHIPENSYINWTQCINFSFAFSFFFGGGGALPGLRHCTRGYTLGAVRGLLIWRLLSWSTGSRCRGFSSWGLRPP